MKRWIFALWLPMALLLAACGRPAPESGTVLRDGSPGNSEVLSKGTSEISAAPETPPEKETLPEEAPRAWCGNTVTTVAYTPMDSCDAWESSFAGGDSVALTNLLLELDYSGEVCKCLPEYRIDTEFGQGYGVSLAERYVRWNGGQTALTTAQLEEVRSILESLAP